MAAAATARKPRKTKAQLLDEKNAQIMATLRAAAVEVGCFEGPYGLLLETPLGRTSVHIYADRVLGQFLDEDMQPWKYLSNVSKPNGKWAYDVPVEELGVSFRLRMMLQRFRDVVVPPPKSWEALLDERPKLEPLPAEPKKVKPFEPAAYFRIVKNAEYVERITGCKDPKFGSDPDEALTLLGPGCYRYQRSAFDTLAEAKARAEEIAASVGGVAEMLYDKPDGPDYTSEYVGSVLDACHALFPQPHEPCPVCGRVSYHTPECALGAVELAVRQG